MTPDSKDDDDIKQHLLNIEARLDRLSTSPQLSFDALSSRHDDEVDLMEIWKTLWQGKWWIIGITFLCAVLAVFYALSLPNWYKTEVVLAPAQEQGGGMGGLAAQYGGLAAMAGINLSSGKGSDVDQAIALVKSWPFLDEFVSKYNIKPLVMAVKGWDRSEGRILFDVDVYDQEKQLWVREPQPNRPSEPTSYEVYKTLVGMISVSKDDKTGLIRIEVQHYVPEVAHEWVEILVREVNGHFQERDIAEAARNIEYLRSKINETSIAEMQSVFYRMIEAQIKTLMLAEVSDEYLLKTIIKPVVPEIKSKPKRALICVLGVVFGGALAVMAVFLKYLIVSVRGNH